MQNKNTLTLEYLNDNDRFADYINVSYFQGHEVIHRDDILELDSSIHKIWKKHGKVNTQSFVRDFIRKVALGTEYVIIGIEHQTYIDYTMPIRIMNYDAGTYDQQLKAIKKCHRRKKDLKTSEFLSGFASNDRLIPVLTSVLYFGEEDWSGPRDLHGLLDLNSTPAFLKDRIPNYTIDILEVRKYPYWNNFKSDLKQVFGYLQHLKDGKTLLKFLYKNESDYDNLEEDTFNLLSSLTNINEFKLLKKKIKNKKGGFNMCKAIQELINDGMVKGRSEGRSDTLVTIILKKLDQGLSADSISYWLDLDREYVEIVVSIYEQHPDYNTSQLTHELLKKGINPM